MYMRELEDEIGHLNLRAEQLLIHLQQLPSGSLEAIKTRRIVEIMVHTADFLKGERARVLKELESAPRRSKKKSPPTHRQINGT
jgi:hypothetical protein